MKAYKRPSCVRAAAAMLGVKTGDIPRIFAPAQFGGCVTVNDRVWMLFDWEGVEALIRKRLGVRTKRAGEIAEALTACYGDCDGCRAADGSGCDAIALFHRYAAETGLPMPPKERP